MAQETRELQDLISVNRFYMQLLQKNLGFAVPVPAEVVIASATAGGAVPAPNAAIEVLHRWLLLMDMAISAPMVRDALKEPTEHPTAESLYRYYVNKPAHTDSDRDKTDFLGTYLLRNPAPGSSRPPAQPGGHTGETYSYMFSQKQAEEFQAEIEGILNSPPADIPPEHQQLLREFQYLHQEADEFRHFDQLMDSSILQRVRDLKSKFGASFYHPKVLAASAVYNVFFGKRFDDLFRDAATQIKAFAAKVQQDGGSIMSRVDGDVTVKNLHEVEESEILGTEYGRAREHFQKVSKFKKAVDSRRSGRPPSMAPAVAGSKLPPSAAARSAPPASAASAPENAPRPSAAANAAVEDNRVKGVIESIRNFVRAADAGAASVVPMRSSNVMLTPGEIEAFKTDFAGEKSFRADYANLLTRLVALHTRMQHEMEDYKSKRSSSYLWKPHADSLTYLVTTAQKSLNEAEQVAVLAGQRGLAEKAKAIQVTSEKLRAQINVVAQTLQA